jgi:soluble lytic murein transglycosylase
MFMFENLTRFGISILLLTVLLTVGCPAQQTEEQALKSLREMTREGKLPPENVVAGIESRFANRKAGVLAKLLHARIRFENNDFAGAAAILNTDVFAKNTKVADHALWLRGESLQRAGNHAEAMKVFENLLRDFPDSIKVRDAKLAWATSAIAIGRASEVPTFLADLDSPDALLLAGKAYDAWGAPSMAEKTYRATYFRWFGTPAAGEAEKLAPNYNQVSLTPNNDVEYIEWAGRLFDLKKYAEAAKAFDVESGNKSGTYTPSVRLLHLTALANSGRLNDAQNLLNTFPAIAPEREEGYRQLALGYAKAKLWQQARTTVEEMRQKFPGSSLVAKTFIDLGLAARDAKNKADESYFLNTAVAAFPNAVEVAQAQFETAWLQHENKSYAISSTMLIDHLARYADKDTTNRGKAGYWAARDSERAGKINDACFLYGAVNYRYSANWYGYLANQRLSYLNARGQCAQPVVGVGTPLYYAAAHLKTVTVAAETATQNELDRAAKSEDLSIVGLFDWAIDELTEAKKTADKSPKINLALAKVYRLRQAKNDNVNAFLALAKSYPDSSQMFPEEMGREEWDIFYPLAYWADIKKWSQIRALDPYQVAGLIRQESVFDPRAASHANAYGLMQLLIPTAQTVARTSGSTATITSAEDLFQPAVNIELGTAFMKDQLAKFGRIEYVAVAYNAGPNRVAPWRASLPAEIDEFVEAIPFRETKAYVQGVIRNTAQYRRLYDENGNFRENVGSHPIRAEIDSRSREDLVAEFPDINVDDRGAE